MGGDRRAAVIAVAAAIGRAEDFVLQRRLAGPAAVLPRDQHGAARAAIGDGALRPERRQRLQDHIGEFQIGGLVGRDRRRRAGIGDGVGRVYEAHHLAHTVVEIQLRIDRADQAIEHASLDHRRAQIDRTPRLPVALAQIEFDLAVLDAHRDGEAHRPVELDAVIVHKTFGGGFTIRQRPDRGAQFLGGAVQAAPRTPPSPPRRRTARRFAECDRHPSGLPPSAHACRRAPVRADGCWRG